MNKALKTRYAYLMHAYLSNPIKTFHRNGRGKSFLFFLCVCVCVHASILNNFLEAYQKKYKKESQKYIG